MSLRGMEEGFLGVFLSLWISAPPSKYIAFKSRRHSGIAALFQYFKLKHSYRAEVESFLHYFCIGATPGHHAWNTSSVLHWLWKGHASFRINEFSIILRNGKTSVLNIFWNIAEIIRQIHEKSNNESIISIKTGNKNSHTDLCVKFPFILCVSPRPRKNQIKIKCPVFSNKFIF